MSAAPIAVRDAAETDIPAMHRIRMAVRENRLSEPDSVRPEHYVPFLRERGRGWVAESGGRVVGFAIADREEASVWALFVDPDFEGMGAGRRLHDAMVDWLFEAGCDPVWLGTSPGTRAADFYEAAGWTRAGARPDGEVRFEMSREQWLARRRAGGPVHRSGPRP